MLVGRYVRPSMRPMIEAHISIPDIGAGGFVQFLIDTGADCTTITPADSRRLRIDYKKLTREDHSMGYSGPALDYLCKGIVLFAELGVAEYEYDIELRVTRPDFNIPELVMLPSLLGRDILNQWRITFDPANRSIMADVLSFDRSNSLKLS